MGLDLAQMTLPQIAAAVAEGEVPLAEAEAELRRRPQTTPRKPPAPHRPVAPPPASAVMHALEETRRELRLATRQLAQLAKRLDALSQLAASLEAPAPTRPAPARQRKLSLGVGEPEPLDEEDDSVAA